MCSFGQSNVSLATVADFDLILRNANVVLRNGVERSDVAISDRIIVGLRPGLLGSGRTEMDCTRLHVLPGVIDSHVHFNEPGRAEWEGISSGSRAVAAGGGTCFFDMPLNSTPPVLDASAFAAKRAAAEAKSVTDFAIWGGLTPLNLGQLAQLSEAGVIGFKAFMSNSGITDFPYSDVATLRAGMKTAAALGTPVAVHAESEEMIKALAAQRRSRRGSTARDYLDSRPIAAELEAIRIACEVAGETGCDLHVVHVSSAAGVELIAAQRTAGVKVTCETCPHYLTLCEDDVLALGPVAKCAPPVRSAIERRRLIKTVMLGHINTIGSDHSPSSPELKEHEDFFAVWGGIAGAQHLLPLMIDLWAQRADPDWPLLARLLSTNVADRFCLPSGFGRIAVGAEASLALVDLAATEEVTTDRLHYRHRLTPYAGRKLRGKIVRTLLRGQTIARDGQSAG
ncbi:MAG TPA: allantoinase AllB, partial [Chthoniobacteraceae bacterium]|nr:allantoinase AllB [Chthoniobacteraceae bacterium]